MAEKIDDRLKVEVELYNKLNKEKKELEINVGKLNQEMLKIVGKIELLQELNENKKKDKK